MLARDVSEAIGDTPLVQVEAISPDEGARVLAKMETTNPTGSMKDRMALAMIDRAEAEGLLDPGQPVVEYTGGSTGSSLAMVCATRDYPLHIVTADCFSDEKIATMRALGAKVEVLETPEGRVYPGLQPRMEARVEALRDKLGAYWTQQMANPHQLDGYGAMAREILEIEDGITDFVMAVGTGGCAMGHARAFRAEDASVHVTLVEPDEAAYLSQGEGGAHGVEGIAVMADPPLVDDALYDDVVTVPEADGRATARRLARQAGLFVGASSGLNLAAAERIARRGDPDDAVVTVAVDTGLKYLAGDLFSSDA